LDEFEITCIVKDVNGIVSHCGVKGYGVQDISIIEKLIREESCSFFTYDGETKKNVFSKTSPDGIIFLTTNPNEFDMNTLNFLPLFDRPFLRQLIESVR
jgi:hypothetical protein